MSQMDWFAIPYPENNKGKPPRDIGAMGVIGNKIATIACYYDDYDGNDDGTVSMAEWAFAFGAKNSQAARVARAAPLNRLLVRRCSGDILQVQRETFALFARDMMIDAAIKVYLMRGVGAAGGMVANKVTSSLVKNILIRKGMSSAVGQAIGMSRSVVSNLR